MDITNKFDVVYSDFPCATVARFTRLDNDKRPFVEQVFLTACYQNAIFLNPRGVKFTTFVDEFYNFLDQLEANGNLASLGLMARLLADGSLFIDDDLGHTHQITENSPGKILTLERKGTIYAAVWDNNPKSLQNSIHSLQAIRLATKLL